MSFCKTCNAYKRVVRTRPGVSERKYGILKDLKVLHSFRFMFGYCYGSNSNYYTLLSRQNQTWKPLSMVTVIISAE